MINSFLKQTWTWNRLLARPKQVKLNMISWNIRIELLTPRLFVEKNDFDSQAKD